MLAYLPDHEPYLTAALDDKPEWISGWALAAGADLLLHDSQYTEEEYVQRLGWGHSASPMPQPSRASPAPVNSRCSTTIPCARTASSKRSTTR